MARRSSRVLTVRLLLDEHFSPAIARQLRDKGHDVIAVAERPDLRGRPDRVLFASLPDQQRAIVTRNVGDFRPLLAEALRSGTRSYGLVCVSRRFTASSTGIGVIVASLAAFLESNPAPDALINQGGEVWLDDPDESANRPKRRRPGGPAT